MRASIAITLIAPMLGSCANPTAFAAIDPPPPVGTGPRRLACGLFQPIVWSARDTDETIRAVKAHNAAYLVACPVSPPP